MTTPRPNPPRNSPRQYGAAMLIMMLIMILGLIALFAFRMDRKGPELDADRKTALALAQAKEALLGNSVTNNITGGVQNPGRLPCPDADNDGGWGKGSPPTCPPSNVGRLPWKFLGVDDLRDGAAERLWYVVDPAFIDNGTAMNSAITPSLAVNGNKVVAVIIAPGPILGALNQQRDTVVNQNNYANYLESYIAPVTVTLNAPSTTYNDHTITITASELFNVVTLRMAHELANYWQKSSPPIPPSSPVSGARPAIWLTNNWDIAATLTNPISNTVTITFFNCSPSYSISLTWTASTSSYTVTRHGAC